MKDEVKLGRKIKKARVRKNKKRAMGKRYNIRYIDIVNMATLRGAEIAKK